MPFQPLSAAAEKVTWDYVTGSVAMAGVLITVAAVLVALFGPEWRARGRRPRLVLRGLDASNEFWDTDTQSQHTEGFLELAAETKRDTAIDVEIYLSLARPSPFKGLSPLRLVLHRRLCFDSFPDSENGDPTSSVPAGFVRRIPWVALGHHRTIWSLVPKGDFPPGWPEEAEAREDDCAVVNLHPRSKRTVSALDTMFGGTYYVYATVTGSNFDAINYTGVLEVSKGHELVDPDDAASPDMHYQELKWVHALTVTGTAPNWLTR